MWPLKFALNGFTLNWVFLLILFWIQFSLRGLINAVSILKLVLRPQSKLDTNRSLSGQFWASIDFPGILMGDLLSRGGNGFKGWIITALNDWVNSIQFNHSISSYKFLPTSTPVPFYYHFIPTLKYDNCRRACIVIYMNALPGLFAFHSEGDRAGNAFIAVSNP